MDITDLYDYCLAKKGVTTHFPFDQDTLAFKVGDKIFVLTSLSDWENGAASLNLKCDPEYAENLRADYEGVLPGFHMNKKHWNTVQLQSDVNDTLVLSLINHSYDLVLKSLTQKKQAEINN